MGVDAWNGAQWGSVIADHDVFVTVPQLLLNMLSAGYLTMSDIGLLIVDECHHTKGKAPGNMVMQQFYYPSPPLERPRVLGMTASPLDAKGNNAAKVLALFKQLEHNLDCKIVTVKDRVQVEEVAPPPKLDWIEYKSESEPSTIDTLHKVILACAQLVLHAAKMSKLREQLNSMQLLITQFPALQGKEDLLLLDEDGGSNTLEDIARILSKVAVCAKDLGPWCAAAALSELLDPDCAGGMNYMAMHMGQEKPDDINPRVIENRDVASILEEIQNLVCEVRQYLPAKMIDGIPPHQLETGLMQYSVQRTFLELLNHLLPDTKDAKAIRKELQAGFRELVEAMTQIKAKKTGQHAKKLLRFVEGQDFIDQVLGHKTPSAAQLPCAMVTDKVTKALNYLIFDQATYGDANPPPVAQELRGSTECWSWSCMVFVQRKVTAMVLQRLLAQLGEYDPAIGKNLSCGMLISNSGKAQSESMSTRAQMETVAAFKQGGIQVLVCSSVAEEGLDIRRCQLVMRFDLPTCARAFVQSKGRARMKNSRMVVLMDQEMSTAQKQVLKEEWEEYEQSMRQLAREQAEDVAADEGEEEEPLMAGDTDEVYIVETTGARISLASAKSLLFHYVQKLPSDKYHNPHPRFRTTQSADACFLATVVLPNNAAIHSAQGTVQRRKALARQSACLAACRELHQLGALTDNLVPVVDMPDMTGYEEIKDVDVQEDPVAPCLRAIPGCLAPSAPVDYATPANQPTALSLHMYSFSLQLPSDMPESLCQHPVLDVARWGVLLQKSLPDLPSFPVWLRDGSQPYQLEMRIEYKTHTMLEREKVAVLQRAHQHLLSVVIGKQEMSMMEDPTVIIPDTEWCSASGGIWYVVAPMQQDTILTAASPIDWDLVQIMSQGDRPVVELMDMEVFSHPGSEAYREGVEELERLVAGKVLRTLYNQMMYLAETVSPSLTLSSPFSAVPSRKGARHLDKALKMYNTYQEYYEEKYEKRQLLPTQPLILALSRQSEKFGQNLKRVDYCMRPDEESKSVAAKLGMQEAGDVVQAEEVESDSSDEDASTGDLSDLGLAELEQQHGPEVPAASMEIEGPGDANAESGAVGEDYPFVEDDGGRDEAWVQDEGPVEGVSGKQGRWLEHVELVPQLCSVMPLPVELWRSVQVLLQLLHRMEWLAAAAELASKKVMPEGSEVNPPVLQVLCCMTTTAAQDHFSLERYELLGDTVLKVCTTTHLFNQFKGENEALLTSRKNLIVSNARLASLGRALGFDSYLVTYSYSLNSWRPPGATHAPPQPPSTKIRSKRVADMMEALLGMTYHHLGSAAAVEFIVHTRMLPREALENIPLVEEARDRAFRKKLMDLCKQNGSLVQQAACHTPILSETREHQEAIRATGWHFTPHAHELLKEAFTHASWPMPNPPCYQRLEFLGDAVLDMVVTYLTFLIYPDATPGMLTEVRKATVNNNRLAYNGTRWKLHTRVLHFSRQLHEEIQRYLEKWEESQQLRGSKSTETASTTLINPSNNSSESIGTSVASIEQQSRGGIALTSTSSRPTSLHANDWASALRMRTTPPVVDAPKVMADIVESLLAVVLLDTGYDMAQVANACWNLGLLEEVNTILEGLSELRFAE